VATLRIADHIDAGMNEIDDLAAAAGCAPDVLHRVLEHLVSQDVFQGARPILAERSRQGAAGR